MLEISVKADFNAVYDRLSITERDQLPFASARALTRTAVQLRNVDAPNSMRSQMVQPVRYTLSGVRWERATKANQTAKVYVDRTRAGYLSHPLQGSPRTPLQFPYVMVPIGLDRLGGKGRVLNSRLAQTYRTRLLSQGDCFEGVVHGVRGIWQRQKASKKGGGGGLKLLVLYLPRTNYRKTWAFYSTLAKRAPAIYRAEIGIAIKDAIATAR